MKLIKLHKKKLDEYIDDLKEQKRSAQQEVYQLTSPKMLSVCRQYIKDIHYAEDVLIAGFMKVFTNVSQYDSKGSFEGWIRRIMVNEAISFLRGQKYFDYLEDIQYQERVSEEAYDLSTEDIQLLIDQLPNGCKAVFNLYVIEGYKHHEIAELLNIHEGTSKSQLAQARKLLQIELEKLKNRGIWNGIK
ncbi:RNA polymerase sigma factor [Myroides injenensis]|uniref:RNA polymerase sigma factor n=1 Tax=Myroides injenensis TaxID=1183151 RepID=UPI000289B25E|nr:RNA polymerase sigma factor [Myroides injenensis]